MGEDCNIFDHDASHNHIAFFKLSAKSRRGQLGVDLYRHQRVGMGWTDEQTGAGRLEGRFGSPCL